MEAHYWNLEAKVSALNCIHAKDEGKEKETG